MTEEVSSLLKNIIGMERLALHKEQECKMEKKCHICEERFSDYDIEHSDHDHFTGKYRRASHQTCNSNYKDSDAIPVIFHNLSEYDAHFLIKVTAIQVLMVELNYCL